MGALVGLTLSVSKPPRYPVGLWILKAAALVIAVYLLAGGVNTSVSAETGTRMVAGNSGVASAGSAPINWGGILGYTSSAVQRVNGTAYLDSTCPTATSCRFPGGITYVSDTNTVVLTETKNYSLSPGYPGEKGVVVFNGSTFLGPPAIALACYPAYPFYPGSGPDVFIPCMDRPSDSWESILVFDTFTLQIAANISVPLSFARLGASLSYNPTSHLLYDCNRTNTVVAIDTTTMSIVWNQSLEGVDFAPASPVLFSPYWFTQAYDPGAGLLLAPNVEGDLSALNVSSGLPQATFPLPGNLTSVAVSIPLDRVIVTSVNQSESFATIMNATTFEAVRVVRLPDCPSSACPGGPVYQTVFDYEHGDAYLSSFGSLLVLNLTTLTVVGSVSDEVGTPVASITSIPSIGIVVGTYAFTPFDPYLPGLLIQLEYHEVLTWSLTSLLWLPLASGIIAVAVVAGALSGLGIVVTRRDGSSSTSRPR